MTDDQPDPLKINPMILMGTSYLNLGGAIGNVFKKGVKYKKAPNI
ncbi:hypothetical protein [Desulfotruncus arcticus]|nr:hypothetical protein [Desulfotruncus arcticus]